MIYPRIYSLSTVGILKHYIHDYLFHPLRTDFIGSNGSGKSIIADLLQLLFIYDTDIIRFGTDGIKKEVRSIYKLPYECNTAYCFLNVEVKKDNYLIIGIAISQHIGSRIVPFVITKAAEMNNDIGQLSLNKDQLLLADDFLQNGSIADIRTLSTKLLQERKLYVTYYRNKEDVKRYYQFLYEKEILSINLAIGENLKAFSKVIQSFSKAKALNLSPSSASKSLKEFLFEDSDTEFEENYNAQQHTLEKLLREFSSLDDYIKLLRQKQQSLSTLKALNVNKESTFKILKKGEINIEQNQLLELQGSEQSVLSSWEEEKNKKAILERKSLRLPFINDALIDSYNKADENHSLVTEYQVKTSEVETLNQHIIELKLLSIPVLDSKWQNEIGPFNIEIRNVELIKDSAKIAISYVNKYPTLTEIEATFTRQKKEISRLEQLTKERKNYVEKLIGILENVSGESILQWAIQREDILSKAQRNLLLHYATTSIVKPAPQKNAQYINPNELFEGTRITIENDNTGFWIKLGALEEFIPFEDDAELFTDPQNFKQSVAALLSKLKNELCIIEQREKEIETITKGKPYNNQFIEYDFDLFLIDYNNVEKLKEAIGCILYLEKKIDQINSAKVKTELRLNEIKSNLPVNIKYDEPEVLKRELKEILNRSLNRIKKYGAFSNQIDQGLKQSDNKITELRTQLYSITEKVLEKQQHLNHLHSEYHKIFSENIEVSDLSFVIPLEKLNNDYQESLQKYQVKYHEIVNQFEETRNSTNVAVNLELEKHSYEFATIEQVLLGHKIRYTDDIAPALEEANRGRLNMADDIKNSMVKIFDGTMQRYKKYKDLVYSVNSFFKGRKISDRFFFSIDFAKNETLKIDFVEEIGTKIRNAARQGELAFDRPVSEFIEEFFRRAAHMTERVTIDKLLNPKTYFDLSVSLTDENGIEIPGSTGETYSAIALLGIARLSIVQSEPRKGLRFIILEEIGSLDSSNFNTFPAIAKEFNYQIVTMAPHAFRSSLADEWYAHHLIKGLVDKNINFRPSASYFKTNHSSEDLSIYLNLSNNELDSVKGAE